MEIIDGQTYTSQTICGGGFFEVLTPPDGFKFSEVTLNGAPLAINADGSVVVAIDNTQGNHIVDYVLSPLAYIMRPDQVNDYIGYSIAACGLPTNFTEFSAIIDISNIGSIANNPYIVDYGGYALFSKGISLAISPTQNKFILTVHVNNFTPQTAIYFSPNTNFNQKFVLTWKNETGNQLTDFKMFDPTGALVASNVYPNPQRYNSSSSIPVTIPNVRFFATNDTTPARFFTADVRNVAIFSRKLTTTEIDAFFADNTIPTSPILYLPPTPRADYQVETFPNSGVFGTLYGVTGNPIGQFYIDIN